MMQHKAQLAIAREGDCELPPRGRSRRRRGLSRPRRGLVRCGRGLRLLCLCLCPCRCVNVDVADERLELIPGLQAFRHFDLDAVAVLQLQRHHIAAAQPFADHDEHVVLVHALAVHSCGMRLLSSANGFGLGRFRSSRLRAGARLGRDGRRLPLLLRLAGAAAALGLLVGLLLPPPRSLELRRSRPWPWRRRPRPIRCGRRRLHLGRVESALSLAATGVVSGHSRLLSATCLWLL